MITIEEYQQLLENKYEEDLNKLTTFFNTNEETIKQKIAEKKEVDINNLQLYYGCRFSLPLKIYLSNDKNYILLNLKYDNDYHVPGEALAYSTLYDLPFFYTHNRELNLGIELPYSFVSSLTKEYFNYIPQYLTNETLISSIKLLVEKFIERAYASPRRYPTLIETIENISNFWERPIFEQINPESCHFFAIKNNQNDENIYALFSHKSPITLKHYGFSAQQLIAVITRGFDLT